MDVDILGQYNFENFTLLNALMSEDEIINTAIHEYTHFGLSNQSVYGTILYCLNKLIIPYDNQMDINRKKAAMDFFMDNTLKVQEGMAVFIEGIYFLLRDVEEYENFIENLMRNNLKYYSYVKPLRFILELLKDAERENVLTVAHAVFQIALTAMNANIYTVGGSAFGTKKLIQKMVSKPDFSKKYIPNKRFCVAIESCKNASSCEDLVQLLTNQIVGKDENNTFDDLNERLAEIKKFVIEIFSESKYIGLYKNSLEKISNKEKDVSEVFLQQLPTAFGEDYIFRNMKKTNYEILKKKCAENVYSTLFVLGNLKSNLSDLLAKMGVDEIGTIEEDKEIVFYYDLENKEVYGCLLEIEQLQEVLESVATRSVLLASYKNFDYENNIIPNHLEINKFTYIYCHTTYSNATCYIDRWKDNEVYYRYMVYESMPVLLIKNSKNSIFILPMTPIVADEADRDIRRNYNKMKMITEVKDEEFDSYVITNSIRRDEIDTIINCLFFLNMHS
ncbi:hypothetical protein IMSAGC019_02135 [Lachnospiraceae bacterium]|nr:hypothetical protein IMSAGC019_02135 [Lachnospiraceae bacterium]